MAGSSKFPDKSLILTLARLLEEANLTEIEIEENGRKIRIARGGKHEYIPPPMSAPPPDASGKTSEKPEGKAEEKEASDGELVTSPMVGTAYLSPEPGAPAFVKPGDKVKKGQSLLIVEAMKTMNHIPAPCSGEVQEILVSDGQPVEFGEPLMRIA